MKIIGLTGGIGSGKSTASAYMAKKGCLILDADALSREMTADNSPYLNKIKQTFGAEFFNQNGSLNRRKLGEYVFTNPEKKALLEKLITEKVIEQILHKVQLLRNENFDGTVIIDAPLLFECGMQKFVDESWLVTADEKSVIARVKKRDGMSEKEIENRILNQMPIEEKKRLANVILDNSGAPETLYLQLDREIGRLENGE